MDQGGVRATIDSSWNLLTEEEQKIYKSLSVFEGSFSKEAAVAVVGATNDTLLKLARMSLVNRNRESRRYTFHQLLYQYAREN